MRVRVAPLIDWRAAVADVVKIGVAGIEAVELRDHGVSLLWAWRLRSPLPLDSRMDVTGRKGPAVRGGGSGRAKSEKRGSPLVGGGHVGIPIAPWLPLGPVEAAGLAPWRQGRKGTGLCLHKGRIFLERYIPPTPPLGAGALGLAPISHGMAAAIAAAAPCALSAASRAMSAQRPV